VNFAVKSAKYGQLRQGVNLGVNFILTLAELNDERLGVVG
jgi:hypothetical protein